ncbi:G-protein coupled receptor Mth-like [Drosophila elegans]|uniref:G-protein coupled receptor Mth-like n=1 Tax=Drosophila elegans TaxID=30023 RepID=UPI001BC865D4|nr:G-protein coupled receptor Mth-like [Drosophila elegans]
MRLLLGLFVIPFLLMLEKTNAEIEGCDFLDTVDVSAGQWLSTGSYLYKDLRIPKNLTGEYDFQLLPDGSKEKVPVHTRGCVCQLTSCVRFCCPPNQIMQNGECFDMTKKELDELDPHLNVTLDDKSLVSKNVRTDIMVQWDLPLSCDSIFYLDNRDKEDEYTLFKNGTLLRHIDNLLVSKREYCFQYVFLPDGNSTTIRIVPNNCLPPEPSKTGQTVVMMISMICLILTIGVYSFLKKLRNLLGKCFMCHMICLLMAYLLLLLDLWNLSKGFCTTAGFMGYFFVMAAFLWLSVLSLHLWRKFHGSKTNDSFLAYSTYAWAMAVVLTGITYLADLFVENEDWKPRVCGLGRCWIKTRDWSAIIYFFGPMLLLVAFNCTMFILTAIRTLQIYRDLKDYYSNQKESRKMNEKNLKKSTFIFLLRLFVIMGLLWSFEIISYLVIDNKFWSNIFLVTDYLNWSHGTIIFVVFVLKGSTLKLSKKRIMSECKETEAETQFENILMEKIGF